MYEVVSVLEQGVNKLSIDFCFGEQPVAKQLASLRLHEPEPQKGWDVPASSSVRTARGLVGCACSHGKPAPCPLALAAWMRCIKHQDNVRAFLGRCES